MSKSFVTRLFAFVVVGGVLAPLTAGAVEVNPILNGDFELSIPIDTSTLPSHVVGLPQDVTCSYPVPQEVPEQCYDLVDPNLQAQGVKPAIWSSENTASVVVPDATGSGHHVKFLSTAEASTKGIPWADHRMWQSTSNPVQQAISGDFSDLSIDFLTAATISGGSYVQVSYSETPVYQQSPWLGIYIDDFQTFVFNRTIQAGTTVHIDPITGDPAHGITASLSASYAGSTAAPAYNKASCNVACKHAILGGLREIQFSFWGFGNGAELDNVFIHGAQPPSPSSLNINPICPVDNVVTCVTG